MKDDLLLIRVKLLDEDGNEIRELDFNFEKPIEDNPLNKKL